MSLTLSLTLFFLIFPPPPRSTLFPYTTLFRSLIRVMPSRRNSAALLSDTLPGFASIVHSISFEDRKSTRLNSSHVSISYAVFCLKKKKIIKITNLGRNKHTTNINKRRKQRHEI